MNALLLLTILSVCSLCAGMGCVAPAKIPVYDFHPNHHVEVLNLGPEVNSSANDYGPALDPDAITLYFSSDREGKTNIYRVDVSDLQTLPLPANSLRELNSGMNDGNIAFSANGERIVFVSCNQPDGKGDCDIYEMLDFGSDEPKMVNLDRVNSEAWDSTPALSTDGNTLYFSRMLATLGERYMGFSDAPRIESSDIDILVSTRGPTGKWRTPKALNEPINSPASELAPWIAPGDSILFFSSDRLGGFGGLDIYVSFRQPNGTWGPVYNMGEPINSAADERYTTMTRDKKTLMFSSNRGGKDASGKYDLYIARFVDIGTVKP